MADVARDSPLRAGLGLKVLCEQDYQTLRQYKTSQGVGTVASCSPEGEKEVIGLFKELIVPEIRKEFPLGHGSACCDKSFQYCLSPNGSCRVRWVKR